VRKAALVLCALLVASAGFLWFKRSQHHKPAQPAVATSQFKKACDVFTLQDANAVLGSGTTQTPSHTDSVTAQKAVTTCLYSYDPGSFSDLISASVLLQGATAASTKQSFSDARPDNAQTVTGYGDQAFWDPNLGQLQILKGQYWVIIAAGSGPLTQRDQDLPHKIADIIVKRL